MPDLGLAGTDELPGQLGEDTEQLVGRPGLGDRPRRRSQVGQVVGAGHHRESKKPMPVVGRVEGLIVELFGGILLVGAHAST
ncbi:hypothetical protein [Rhabdothermincola sediminis]|uniref:hypothetical protein n=1 Tax=Rhabdothermincola sediminis TaxID=2751370 RepID=UPI001AA066FF|nr:hypothetical protein [Rhabdothermincola sediminis]